MFLFHQLNWWFCSESVSIVNVIIYNVLRTSDEISCRNVQRDLRKNVLTERTCPVTVSGSSLRNIALVPNKPVLTIAALQPLDSAKQWISLNRVVGSMSLLGQQRFKSSSKTTQNARSSSCAAISLASVFRNDESSPVLLDSFIRGRVLDIPYFSMFNRASFDTCISLSC